MCKWRQDFLTIFELIRIISVTQRKLVHQLATLKFEFLVLELYQLKYEFFPVVPLGSNFSELCDRSEIWDCHQLLIHEF